MKTALLKLAAFSCVALVHTSTPSGLAAQNQLEDTRSVLDKWVETRQIISKEKADWQTDSAILTDTVDLLESELEQIKEEIATLQENATASEEKRAELTEEQDRLNAGSGAVLANLGDLERKLGTVVKRLPSHLLEKIEILVRSLPDDPVTTKLSLGERVRNVVGILSQADKANTTLTLTSETQELDDGKVVQVNTLYWGLAIAYFVDDSGTYAGIGTPAADGWEWKQIEGSGPAIRELLDQNDGSADNLRFVDVPAVIK